MSEYIEREAAEKVASRYGCTNGVVIGRHSGLADCIALEIAKLPVADVAPVKHGKWIRNPDYESWAEMYVCSACNRNALTDGDYRHKLSDYCPNCGAKMDLED